MTNSEKIKKIEYAICLGMSTRVHFSLRLYRLPVVGKFVKLKDHNELIEKLMFRFVTLGKMESFELTGSQSTYFTRIFNIDEVSDIVYYDKKV